MRRSENLYRAFLEEMNALESFRAAYTAAEPDVVISRDEPDVRRFVEAIAFFAARTRTLALDSLLAERRRLFQRFLAFLVDPLPAAALVRFDVQGGLADPVEIPVGTSLQVTVAGGEPALFHTTRALRVLPITLREVRTVARPEGGVRVIIELRARHPRGEEPGEVRLHVTHMDHYLASLHLLRALETHLEAATVLFGDPATERTEGKSVAVTFGTPLDEADPEPSRGHPIRGVRSFTHFPEQDLFVCVQIDDAPTQWRSFSICFDLDTELPREVTFNREVFKLHVVPVTNLHRAMAEPILCDGTAERYPLRSTDARAGFAIQAVTGVYEILDAGGLKPLRPAALQGGEGSYEVESDGEDGLAALAVDLPRAFESPVRIAVEADWYQPWIEQSDNARVAVAFVTKSLPSLTPAVQGTIRRHVASVLKDDVDGMLNLLAIKGKPALSLEDVLSLLEALGTLRRGQFREVPDLLTALEVSITPGSGAEGGGLRRVYRFGLKPFHETRRPLVLVFLDQVARLLSAWVPDGGVSVEVVLPGTDEVVVIA